VSPVGERRFKRIPVRVGKNHTGTFKNADHQIGKKLASMGHVGKGQEIALMGSFNV